MWAIGCKEKGSFLSTDNFLDDLLMEGLRIKGFDIEQFMDVSKDHIGLDLEIIKEICRALSTLLDKELPTVKDNNYSSVRYHKYQVITKPMEISIDRLNPDQRLIMDIDGLLDIFQNSLEDPSTFFFYTFSNEEYDSNELQAQLHLIHQGYDKQHLTSEILQLKKLGFLMEENGEMRVTHKATEFLGFQE